MLSLIYKFLKSMDMYKAPATLRARGEPGVSSFCLGVFSILLFAMFLTLFIIKMKSIVTQDSDSITYSSTFTKDFNDRTVENVMFGISFQYTGSTNISIKPDDFLKYFYMRAQIWNNEGQKYDQVNLTRCQPQSWKLLGQDYEDTFKKSKLVDSYCLSSLRNVFSNKTQSAFSKILFGICQDNTTCPNSVQAQSFYNQIITSKETFSIYLSLLSSYPQSNDKDPLKYYLYSPKFQTTRQTGQQVFMYFDKFVVSTDVSLLPILTNMREVSAYTFSQNFYADFYFETNITSIFELSLYTSKNVITYNRQLEKIDSALSYVGGLFGLVLFFFSFFLKPFNEYRYELIASQSSFNYSSDGRRFKEKDFNFLTYCQFQLYRFFKFFCGERCNWKLSQEIYETLDQSRKLLDVEKLFRRIQFMEKVLQKKVSKNLLMSLTLQEQKSIREVKKKRMLLDYYKQVIRLEEAATVGDAMQPNNQDKFKYEAQLFKKLNLSQQNKLLKSSTMETNNQINSQSVLTKSQQLKQELIKYLNLQGFQDQCEKVSEHVVLAMDAQAFKFQDEQQQEGSQSQSQKNNSQSEQAQQEQEITYDKIQRQITRSFLNVKIETKRKLIGQIPIKILHRMRISAMKMSAERGSSNSPMMQSQILRKGI